MKYQNVILNAVFVALAAVILSLTSIAPAMAQSTSDRIYQAALKRGNTAYNDSDYDAAIESYVAAIQAGPQNSQAYLNLARSYFWKGKYAAAAAYYDHYLRLAPDAEGIEQVKAERRLASERARDSVYTLPESQRLATEALSRELESGRAYTRGGGGAWGLYETVLRTGYAEPQLTQLRSRLARRLLDEFDATLVPEATQLTPRLDLDAWQLQSERLAAAQSIADDPALAENMKTRSTIVEAAIAMLTSRWREAAQLARLARASNPDLDFLGWFEVSALIGAEQHQEALTLLDEISREVADRDPANLDYVRVLRAITLQRLGRHDDAAELYLEVLRR